MALFELLRQRRIQPLFARPLPLTEARRAHELLGKGRITGKIVLHCGQEPLPVREGERQPARATAAQQLDGIDP